MWIPLPTITPEKQILVILLLKQATKIDECKRITCIPDEAEEKLQIYFRNLSGHFMDKRKLVIRKTAL